MCIDFLCDLLRYYSRYLVIFEHYYTFILAHYIPMRHTIHHLLITKAPTGHLQCYTKI